MLNWLARQPLRKPLAVISAVFTLILVLASVMFRIDIPPGAASVLTAYNAIVIGGYFGSSAYEAVRRRGGDEP